MCGLTLLYLFAKQAARRIIIIIITIITIIKRRRRERREERSREKRRREKRRKRNRVSYLKLCGEGLSQSLHTSNVCSDRTPASANAVKEAIRINPGKNAIVVVVVCQKATD